jgi:uncharacterized protein YegP (UPF0339 family)
VPKTGDDTNLHSSHGGGWVACIGCGILLALAMLALPSYAAAAAPSNFLLEPAPELETAPGHPLPLPIGPGVTFPESGSSSHKGLGPAATVPEWAKNMAIHFAPMPPPSGTAESPSGSEGSATAKSTSGSGAGGASLTPSVAHYPPLRYNNGYVQHRPHVFVIFWGSNWNEHSGNKEKLDDLYRWISGSNYAAILTQYFDHNGAIGKETDLSSYTDTRAKRPSEITQAKINAEIQYSINTQSGWGSPNYEDQFVVVPAPEATYSMGTNYCAYHFWEPEKGATGTLLPLPEGPFELCSTYWLPAGAQAWQDLQFWGSHEWSESATDPIPSVPYLGWEGVNNETSEEEVADLCDHAGIGVAQEPAPGIWVQKVWDNYLDVALGTEYECVAQDSSPVRYEAATYATTNIVNHTATLNGAVNPAGYPGYYQFEFSHNGETIMVPSSSASVGEGFSSVGVSQSVSGLKGNTTYSVRLISSSQITESFRNGLTGNIWGEQTQFTTPPWSPPAVTTEAATTVSSTGATMNGAVTPNSLETKYYFEYGLTAAYGSKTSEVSAGSGSGPVKVNQALTGLEFGRQYHYRLVAWNNENEGSPTKGADQTFATGWRLQSNSPPTGAKSDELAGVSCVSTTYCIGVGSYQNSSNVYVTLAELWNGSNWEILPTKDPSGSEQSELEGVSCTASSSCVAAGFYHDKTSGHYLPFAEKWNGVEWESPTIFEPEPHPGEKTTHSYLFGVSCTSSSACMAVGYYFLNGNLTNSMPFAERLSGSGWEAQYPSNYETPGGEPTHEQNSLRSVSCSTSTDCVAVGIHLSSVSLNMHYEAIGEHWTGGTTWAVQAPKVTGQTDTWLRGVSCSSSSACTAIGTSANGHSSESIHKPLAMRWNGTAWTVQATPTVEGSPETYFEGVSCPSSTSCIAIGEYGDKNPLGMRWNGTTWELHTLPIPPNEQNVYLDGVSCSSSTACMGVGNFENSSHYHGTLSESYVKTLPATATTKAATGITELEATLKGTVNPNGSEAKYWFEYGTTTSYGSKTAETSAGSGSSAIEESKAITGLAEGTKYHFRIVASNSESTAYGKDEVLETKVISPPTVTTKAATSITESGATVNGSVNPNGHSTTYWFEYGLTTSYGTKTTETSAGSGSSAMEVSSALSGLELGTKYHFRLSASNGKTTVNGKDETFETEAGIKGQLASMKTTDPFNETTSGISNFSTNWSALGWAGGTTPKGLDRTTGWGPSDAYSTVNGAYYQPTETDVGSGIADEATLATNPANESRYFSLWLDMSSPSASTRSGYELRFTDTATNTYTVTLSKWKEGTQTVLGTKTGYSFVNGNSFALVDHGGTVSAWTNTGSGFGQLLSASDSTFEGGNAGVEGSGNITRLTSFKVGALQTSVANTNAALKALHLTDAFATTESPLSESGAWAALNWDTSTSGHNTGQDTTSGWGPSDPFSTVNGAYWQKASFADTGSGDAAAAVLGTSPELESRYFSLWLNSPSPGSAHSGYELRFTQTPTANVYEVALLKWVAGTKTVLASTTGAMPVGTKFALVDKSGTVSAWTVAGTEYTQILSGSDSTYTSGYSGVEGAGNFTRLKEFRSGQMAPF